MTSLGTRIRDYEIWGRLGEGGMSEVWLGKHAVLNVPIIIKTLRRAIGDDDAGVARVLREARLMARVTSPRVVRAIDAGVHEGTPYLVQEYVDGLDLAELDRRRRAALGVGLPLWFVSHVMKEICTALHTAHQAGVIHRDVKPSNVFGSADVGIRLGDFGIAVAHGEGKPREPSGTIMFSAPEQLRGDAVDRYTDVYGAGATACDLRYGRTPYPTLTSILDPTHGPVLPEPQTAAEAYFQFLVRKMVEKDPARRPDDPNEAARHFATLARALRPGSLRAPVTCVDKQTFKVGPATVALVVGDLAAAQADAIVSSANYELKMRVGVGNALRLRGGDEIEEEALKHGEQPLGQCVATKAGKLAARHVLHAVSAWNEASCVGRAMHRALLMSDELGHRSLAFPALGTGSARVSLEMCANAMMAAVGWHVALGGSRLQHVRVYLGDEDKLKTFREVAEEALRDVDEAGGGFVDLGLPESGSEVRADAVTHVDAAKGTGPL
jgi:serine/threonine-protein kinase